MHLIKRIRRKWFDHPRKVRWFVWQMFLTRTQIYNANNEEHYLLVRHPLDCSVVDICDWQGLKLSGVEVNKYIVN